MKERPKPISLRPMSREMKVWRFCFIFGFIIAISFGWYMTVGRSIGTQVTHAGAGIADTISTTTQAVSKDGNPIERAKTTFGGLGEQFQESMNVLKGEVVREEIYQNMITEIKTNSDEKQP